MKNILCLLLIVTLGFTACHDDPPGVMWISQDFTITKSMWRLEGRPDDIGSYYVCIFDVPELTQDIYYDGLISVYFRYIDGIGYEVMTPLPYTSYGMYIEGGFEFPYAVQYSYNVTPTVGSNPGTIAFILTFSDFFTGAYGPPETCKFRMTLTY